MNVLIVGAGKSPNVGDQLIEKVLGWTLVNNFEEIDAVSYFDLTEGAYSIDFKQPNVEIENIKENVESKRKSYFLRFIKTLLNVSWSDKSLSHEVEESDVILIGGGHLLIDNYGSFLLNIIKVIRCANKLDKKIVFWSVGVGSKHSLIWRFLAKKYMSDIPLYARDSVSYQRALRLGFNALDSLLDPAFFVNEIKPTANSGKSDKLGLFIMDPYEMVRHSNNNFKRHDIATWWLNLLGLLSSKFNDITIYNNGSLQDMKFIHKYILPNIKSNITVKERALSSDQLIAFVKEPDVILAQRLHAVIPGIAFNKKIYALEWDDKLTHILQDIQSEERMLSYNMAPRDVFNTLASALAPNVDLSAEKLKYINTLKSVLGN
ncbi:MAG: polysaccharide pyruvyl transferase WcaK-like protein [Psychromonas sp.]|jgi:polysaccharide pyruvyl transferase WcaK-like protein|uniref:polysaccharide pyruvyl transferase family protein n=1 Tax=Psychromonas sp. TaxID=1884585 RepID=UPI0039E412E1